LHLPRILQLASFRQENIDIQASAGNGFIAGVETLFAEIFSRCASHEAKARTEVLARQQACNGTLKK
jgi:hypothetical protein